MKMTFDPKSMFVGGAAVALLIFATGANNGGPVGRYQVSVGGEGRAVIVDTMTGQAWTGQVPTGPITIGTNTFLTTKGN